MSNFLAGRFASYVEPSPSQQGTDITRERREIVSWDNVSIHGLLYTLLPVIIFAIAAAPGA
jgi:hypothetical protein